MKRILTLIILIALVLSAGLTAQQVADIDYNPVIENPAYAPGNGPVIFIDEGHFNFHTKEGRYLPFARLLEKDGYRTEGYNGVFEAKKLKKGRILVISNALNEADTNMIRRPGLPAFSSQELETVSRWVKKGGSLFLIADHMPAGGAAKGLAAAFGFGFTDGFAVDTANPGMPVFFYRSNGTLADNIITSGRNMSEWVDTIASFTGQAFTIDNDASPILRFNQNCVQLLPDSTGIIDSNTRMINVENWSQAAFKKYGRGKIVVAGEAAMFTAQLAGPQQLKAGMNSSFAGDNYKLLLNIIHWLDDILE